MTKRLEESLLNMYEERKKMNLLKPKETQNGRQRCRRRRERRVRERGGGGGLL